MLCDAYQMVLSDLLPREDVLTDGHFTLPLRVKDVRLYHPNADHDGDAVIDEHGDVHSGL